MFFTGLLGFQLLRRSKLKNRNISQCFRQDFDEIMADYLPNLVTVLLYFVIDLYSARRLF